MTPCNNKQFEPGERVWVFIRRSRGNRFKLPAIYARPTKKGHRYYPDKNGLRGTLKFISDEWIERRE